MSQPLGERWRRLSRRQQLTLLIGGGLVALWAADSAAFRPLRSRLASLKRDVQAAEQELVHSLLAVRQREAVAKAFTAYEPYVKPSGSAEAEVAGFSSEVESALSKSGMVVLSLKPVTPRAGARTDAISVAIEGESSPGQLLQFLEAIQRSPRLLKVTELAVRVSESRTLRCSLVISKLLLPT